MNNTRKPVTNKPLNCLYCLNAVLTPGSSRTAYFEATRPTPNCFCYDVPHELFDLYLLRVPDNEIDLYAWLPYHCGHFIPRFVRQGCKVCKKIFIIPEWKLVQKQYLTFGLVMVCSKECHVIYINGGSNG